ncbi:MAG TPA: hypothetical protein VMT63_00365 [Bacteroidales bacterium]|nr:hypothetical protein [Bacteroidales bacterium]
MKTNLFRIPGCLILATLLFSVPMGMNAQTGKRINKKYFENLPDLGRLGMSNGSHLRMTAIYVSIDQLGNTGGKIIIKGDYSRDPATGKSSWNNVTINNSPGDNAPAGPEKKIDYMENFTYVSGPEMLNESAFRSFPESVEAVYAKNLVWDMMTVESFAWNHCDSLRMNKPYYVAKKAYEFDMAGIGDYSHKNIQLEWSGVSLAGGKLCAGIEYRALYNKVNLNMQQIKAKGSEQYWGNTRVSLETGQVVFGEMYSSTSMEAEVPGFDGKMPIKAVREIIIEEIR